MSKPRIIAQHDIPSIERRVISQPSPVHVSPQVEVRVEFDKGDHESALSHLRSCVAEVERQIAESHAPTWDRPREVGEEES